MNDVVFSGRVAECPVEAGWKCVYTFNEKLVVLEDGTEYPPESLFMRTWNATAIDPSCTMFDIEVYLDHVPEKRQSVFCGEVFTMYETTDFTEALDGLKGRRAGE